MTATPRYYPAEDAPRSSKKVVAKVQNVSSLAAEKLE